MSICANSSRRAVRDRHAGDWVQGDGETRKLKKSLQGESSGKGAVIRDVGCTSATRPFVRASPGFKLGMGADMQYAQELARRGWIADHENVIHEVELEGSAVCRPRIVQYVRVVGVGHAPLA